MGIVSSIFYEYLHFTMVMPLYLQSTLFLYYTTFENIYELIRENLPEDHPDKPKDWLSQTLARVAASVTTEVAGLGGYEVTMTDYLGACKVASVNLLAANQVFYWVGVFGKWRFVTRRDVESDKND